MSSTSCESSSLGSLRANLGGRFTHVDVETFADRNLDDQGQSLGVVDSSRSYQDWTFNTSISWQPATPITIHALVGRGFRAPNLNDLGALGLNDLGYEVPAEATLDSGSLIGTSDGESAVSSGRSVSGLEAERLMNYEAGATLHWGRLRARTAVFRADLRDPIVRRTLLFPADLPPTSLAGQPVAPVPPTAAQQLQGVVAVATPVDPRAVKAFVNDGRARYSGVDATWSYRLSSAWSAEANYSYLVGHDLNPTRPVRRLPPQQGRLAVRYGRTGRLRWIEASAHFSGRQKHLSGGDLTDERIGAARRRSDIADFFRGGLVSGFILPGGDGLPGTADDVFALTNETLAQIRDRVLPLGSDD